MKKNGGFSSKKTKPIQSQSPGIGRVRIQPGEISLFAVCRLAVFANGNCAELHTCPALRGFTPP
jgi:hypothetical protein